MSKFKIKFYILKNDLEEMRTMNLQELESEYGNIYGQFTFEIDDYEYIFFTEEYFKDAKVVSKMYEIDYSQFVSEVNDKLKKFVAILKETNELQRYNKHLVRLMN